MTWHKGKSGNPKGGKPGQFNLNPPKQLSDMRWAYENPTTPTDQVGRKDMQALRAKDFDRFLTPLQKEEKDWRAYKDSRREKAEVESTVPGGTVQPDEGTDRIEELIESILARAEQESQ